MKYIWVKPNIKLYPGVESQVIFRSSSGKLDEIDPYWMMFKFEHMDDWELNGPSTCNGKRALSEEHLDNILHIKELKLPWQYVSEAWVFAILL